MGGLAEAALAYTLDEPHPLSNQAPAGLTLVADNGAAGEDAESVAVKAEATQLLTEILRMDLEVKAGLGPEIALLKAAQQSGRASGIDFERIRDRIAAAESNAQNSKVETPEQKRERLWNEAIKAEQRAQEESHKFDAYKDKDDLDKENAAEKKYNDAVEEYERLKASGASEAELEEARKRIALFHEELSKAREVSLQGVIDNPKTPPEVREQAQQSLQEIKGHDENARQLFARAEKGNLIEQQSKQEDGEVRKIIQTITSETATDISLLNNAINLKREKIAAVQIEVNQTAAKESLELSENKDFLALMGGDTTPQPPVQLTDAQATHPEAAPTFRVASSASAETAWAKT